MNLLVYRASAGSGKTYTLALRYISLILKSKSPTAFTGVLAVTFTNKATGEMKDRILGQLYNLAAGGTDEGFLKSVMEETKLPKTEVCQRAKDALNAIVHDYDHFRVETIDSFFQSLLVNLAHELGLTRGFRVDLDDKDVISKAVDRLLLSLGTGGSVSTEDGLLDKVTTYMQRHVEDNKGWDISADLKTFAGKNLFSDVYLHNDTAISRLASNAEEMNRIAQGLRHYIRQTDEELYRRAEALKKSAEVAMEKGIKKGSTLVTYAERLMKREYTKELAGAVVKAREDALSLLTEAQKDDTTMVNEAENLQSLLLKADDERLERLPLYCTCLLTVENLEVLGLLGAIEHEVTDLTSEEGTTLLAKTPKLFSDLVRKTDATFVFERVGTTFRHVMIDEFQDTSRLQWHNFKELFIEYLSTGGDCMVVGDVKQSIYRWRGGDWAILRDIGKEFPKAQMRQLATNYRSKSTVVRFNNAFFVKAAAWLDGVSWEVPTDWLNHDFDFPTHLLTCGTLPQKPILPLYYDVQQKVKSSAEGGYVRISLLSQDVTADEVMQKMYEQMQTARKHGVPYGNMSVLVRTNSQAAQIIEYFTANHPEVPITSDEAFVYTASSMVMTLVMALKSLADETDTVALQLMSNRYGELYEEGKYDGCLDEWQDILKNKDERRKWMQLPLYELSQRICALLRFEEIEKERGGEGQAVYLYGFMDAMLNYLNEKPSDLYDFLDYWDTELSRKAIETNAAESVYVLTVHKAKGLQKHTVFVPFADFAVEKDMQGNYLWCQPDVTKVKNAEIGELIGKLPLVPIKTLSSTKVKESIYAEDYNIDHQQQRVDSLNTLYVAFTRAEENLFVWSTKKARPSVYELVDAFVNDRAPETATPVKKSGKKKADTPSGPEESVTEYGKFTDYVASSEEKTKYPFETKSLEQKTVSPTYGKLGALTFRQSNQARQFLTQATGSPSTATGTANPYIDRGLLYHKLFSLISTTEDVDNAIRSLSLSGVFASEKEESEARDLVKNALSHRIASQWFDIDGKYTLYTERDLLCQTEEGQKLLRPDRVMVRDGETVVVDYKFGRQMPEYSNQVRSYMQALQQMGCQGLKGYVWYVFTNDIQEVSL